MKFDNFKKTVPENVQEKIYSLAESIIIDNLYAILHFEDEGNK